MTPQFAALSNVLERAWRDWGGTFTERPTVADVIEDVQDLAGEEWAAHRSDRVSRCVVAIAATNLPSGIVEVARLKEEMSGVYLQVAEGKGQERHGEFGVNVQDQPGVRSMLRWGFGFPGGQAEKKLTESQRLPAEHAERERRGAAGYLALWLVAEEA